jgi:hypothetical protein
MDRPIFAEVFADQWDDLPPVLKAHYGNRPFSCDSVTRLGRLDIAMSPLMRRFRWLLRLTGVLTPFEGRSVPCEVRTLSCANSRALVFERRFTLKTGAPYVFRSEMVCAGPHTVMEWFRFGGGWKASYHVEDGRVMIRHLGYAWRLSGRTVPLPRWLDKLFGTGTAFEAATGPDRFDMGVELNHPLHRGPMFSYGGEFTVLP